MTPEYFYLYLENDDFAVKKLISLLRRESKLPLTGSKRFNDPFDAKIGLDHSRKKITLCSSDESAVTDGFPKEAFIEYYEEQDELEIQRRYNVACFSECYDSLLMWAHYADGHKGLCLQLEYDSGKLPDKCFFEKVRYSSHYPEIDVTQTEDISVVKTFYLTKAVEWLYEKEWRLVAPASMKGNNGFDGEIESPFTISRIYLGALSGERRFQYCATEFRSIMDDDKIQCLSEIFRHSTVPTEALDEILVTINSLSVSDCDSVKVADIKRRAVNAILRDMLRSLHIMGEFEVVKLETSASEFRLEEQ
jgi:hypothetical protein